MTIYVYEAHVRKVCSLGFKYFFSYLSINIITLAFINIIFLEYFDNLFIRSFATIVSILIAYLTLSMPSIKNRKLDLAKVYIEIGDNENAEVILQDVVKKGDAQQQFDAQQLLDNIT